MEERKFWSDPPEKVLLMYQAVADMIAEGADVNSMKVSDITTRAGIGKGTAYEYFSSREEIITGALVYDIRQKWKELAAVTRRAERFEEKVYGILDYLEDKFADRRFFCTLVRIGTGSIEVSDTFREEYRKIREGRCDSEVEQVLDLVIEQGLAEGVLTERDPCLGRIALSGQMLAFATFLVMREQGGELTVTTGQAKEFVYRALVSSLSGT